MGYWVKRVFIDGFMNIVPQQRLDFGRGINIITGPGGAGKSNLLRSVTWSLTGLMPPSYGGYEVVYEVVNSNREEAKVTLELTGPTDLKVTRTAKRSTESLPVSQKVTLQDSHKVVTGKAADAEVRRILKIRPVGFFRSSYLEDLQENLERIVSEGGQELRYIAKLIQTEKEWRDFAEVSHLTQDIELGKARSKKELERDIHAASGGVRAVLSLCAFFASNANARTRLPIALLDCPEDRLDDRMQDAFAAVVAGLARREQVFVVTQSKRFVERLMLDCDSPRLFTIEVDPDRSLKIRAGWPEPSVRH